MTLPRLVVHNHASVDGRLTLAPEVVLLFGDPRWSAVAGADEDVYAALQAEYDPQVFLEGSGSFCPPGTEFEPLPAVDGDAAALGEDFLPEEVAGVPGRKWLAVVDTRGLVRWLYKEFPGETWAGWHVLVIVSRSTPPEYLAYLRRERIPYLAAGEGRADLRAALEKLAGLGARTVVSTGGGRLNGALLRAGLVDEVSLTFFPALIGGTATPSLFDSPELRPEEAPARLELLSCGAQPNGQVRLRYRAVREEA